MTTLFIRHKVKDYAAWKQVYDAYDRKADRCTHATVHRDPDQVNLIVVTVRFPDLRAAKAHANSASLRSAMLKAGVTGVPELWIAEDIEDVSY